MNLGNSPWGPARETDYRWRAVRCDDLPSLLVALATTLTSMPAWSSVILKRSDDKPWEEIRQLRIRLKPEARATVFFARQTEADRELYRLDDLMSETAVFLQQWALRTPRQLEFAIDGRADPPTYGSLAGVSAPSRRFPASEVERWLNRPPVPRAARIRDQLPENVRSTLENLPTSSGD